MWQSYTRPMFEHDPSLPFSVFFAASLLLGLMLKVWLLGRQVRHVAAHRNTVPAPFASRIDLASHQKAADYTIAKARMAVITTAVVLGRRWNRLNRALPTRLPNRSPRVETTPPSRSMARISSQPDTSHSRAPSVSPLRPCPDQLKRLARAMGSKTVIFLRSI